MRDIGLTLLIAGLLVPSFGNPFLGALVYAWVSLMNPHRLTWSFAYSLPFAMISALVTLVAWIASKEPKRVPLTWLTVLLLVMAFWVSFTTLFAMVPEAAFDKWLDTMKIMLMTYVTIALTTTRKRLDILIWVVACSIAFYGLKGGVFALIGTGGEYLVYGPAQSFIGANNALALALVMVIPLLRYLSLQTTNAYVRWGLFGTMGFSVFAILASYSRGALLAIAAMLVWFVLKSRKRFLGLLLLAITAGAAFAFMPSDWMDRMETIETYEEDKSVQGRFDAWRMAYNVAKAHPFVGGGFSVNEDPAIFMRYNPEAFMPRAFHSNYFEVLGEHGFVGLFLFLMVGLAGLFTCGWMIRRSRGRPDLVWARDLGAMAQVSLVGYAVGGAFLNKAFFDLYYFILAIVVAGAAIVAKAPAETPRAPARHELLDPLRPAVGAGIGRALPDERGRRAG